MPIDDGREGGDNETPADGDGLRQDSWPRE